MLRLLENPFASQKQNQNVFINTLKHNSPPGFYHHPFPFSGRVKILISTSQYFFESLFSSSREHGGWRGGGLRKPYTGEITKSNIVLDNYRNVSFCISFQKYCELLKNS